MSYTCNTCGKPLTGIVIEAHISNGGRMYHNMTCFTIALLSDPNIGVAENTAGYIILLPQDVSIAHGFQITDVGKTLEEVPPLITNIPNSTLIRYNEYRSLESLKQEVLS